MANNLIKREIGQMTLYANYAELIQKTPRIVQGLSLLKTSMVHLENLVWALSNRHNGRQWVAPWLLAQMQATDR